MEHVRIAIIGSGFSGIAAAVRLRKAGIGDFTILEKAGDVGGTWRDNRYPGCACDVPSQLYSLSFAPNPNWTRSFPQQPEIEAYLRDVADRFGLRAFLRTGHEVRECRWLGDRWLVRTSAGELTAHAIISAAGFLSTPRIPRLPGLEDFRGVVMHTAQWDPDVDLRGKRVAVIGTGASASQVIPQIQRDAAFVHVLQRTPAWVLPRHDRTVSETEKSLLRSVPLAPKVARGLVYALRETVWMPAFVVSPRLQVFPRALALAYLRREIADPRLRRALTPDYEIGCKRILLSNDYLRALAAPNCELIPSAAQSVTATSVVAADGREREVDVIVLATGFHVTDSPVPDLFVGREGRRLSEVWQVEGISAFRGTSVAGFPNLFFLLGPNTALGHGSVVQMAESQLPYVVGALRAVADGGAVGVEPRAEAQREWNAGLQADLARTVWSTGGCQSWYQDAQGRLPTLWPRSTVSFMSGLRRFDPAEHVLIAAGAEDRLVASATEGE